MRGRRGTAVAALWGLLLGLAGGAAAGGEVGLVVADLAYERVWAAALQAVDGYPLERAADGVIVTGPRERPARPGEGAFERVAERVTIRVEPVGVRVTRVTVAVEASGWRGGAWVPIADTAPLARDVLARIRQGWS